MGAQAGLCFWADSAEKGTGNKAPAAPPGVERAGLRPSAQRVTGKSQLGPHSFGMSVHAGRLKNLMVRGTRPMEVAAGSAGMGGSWDPRH